MTDCSCFIQISHSTIVVISWKVTQLMPIEKEYLVLTIDFVF